MGVLRKAEGLSMPLQSPERIDGKGHNDDKDPHSCRVSRVRTYVYLCPLHVMTILHHTARHRHTAACRSAGGQASVVASST